MSEVVPFKVVELGRQPVAEVVTALEQLLEDARAGKITALAYSSIVADGSFTTWWSTGREMNFALCAGVTRLAWRYQAEAFSEVSGDHRAPL